MSEPRDDRELADRTSTALRDLHQGIRERVQLRPSAELRRRAERTDRMRYASAVAAGAAALLVLVVVLQVGKSATGPSVATSPEPSQSQRADPPSSPPPHTTADPFDNVTVDVAANPDVP